MPQLLPHGWYSLVPTVLATMAWTCSLFQEGCDYAFLKGEGVSALADSDGAPFLEIGFEAYREPRYDPASQKWKIQYTGSCLEYPTSPVNIAEDTYWQVSKFLDFCADVLGGAGAFFLWFSTCCVFSPGTWRMTGCEVFCAALMQALSFLWFRNGLCGQEGAVCEFSWGAKMDVVAGVLWLLAALIMFAHYPQAVDDDWIEEDEEDELYDEDDGMYDDVDDNLHHPPQTVDGHVAVPLSSPSQSSFASEQLSGQFSGEASYEPQGRKNMDEVQIV